MSFLNYGSILDWSKPSVWNQAINSQGKKWHKIQSCSYLFYFIFLKTDFNIFILRCITFELKKVFCANAWYVTQKQNFILLVRIHPLRFRLAHGRMMKVCEQVTGNLVRWWNNIQQHLRQFSSLSKSQVNVSEQRQSGFTDMSSVFSLTDSSTCVLSLITHSCLKSCFISEVDTVVDVGQHSWQKAKPHS